MPVLTFIQRINLPIMKKHLIIICNLACLIGFLSVLLGCDPTADKAAAPKIVRKKIHAQTAKKTRPPETKSLTKSRPTTKAKPTARQPATGTQAPQQPLIAQKSETSAAKPGKAVKPKPPVTPKSDISITRQPSVPSSGAKTDINQKAMASTSAAEKAKSSSKIQPIYNPKGKIDPFEPLFKEKPRVGLVKSKRKKRIPRTPLEKIDISQLKLVGIILASSGNRALIEESSGKGYVIKKGTYMGTNSGKVVRIEKDKVIVAEEYEDIRGNVTLRNKEIKLPKPPGDL
jgi:type IV pilus assembly protein PilP